MLNNIQWYSVVCLLTTTVWNVFPGVLGIVVYCYSWCYRRLLLCPLFFCRDCLTCNQTRTRPRLLSYCDWRTDPWLRTARPHHLPAPTHPWEGGTLGGCDARAAGWSRLPDLLDGKPVGMPNTGNDATPTSQRTRITQPYYDIPGAAPTPAPPRHLPSMGVILTNLGYRTFHYYLPHRAAGDSAMPAARAGGWVWRWVCLPNVNMEIQ